MNCLKQELNNLFRNKRQREAYLYDDHCVVQAGPGSGKTATLTLKIMRLLTENVQPPRGLACVTYNNEAVREFKNRLKKLGLAPRANIFLGTVHSFCLNSVIIPFAKIFSNNLPFPIRVAPDKIISVCLQKAMDKVRVNEKLSYFKTRFDRYRRTYIDRKTSSWYSDDEECALVIENYETLLRQKNYLDFDDMVLISLSMIENETFVRQCLYARYPWFIIDEYQDLGYPLHRIVLALMDNTEMKIFAVGDPDQSIYGFTGANPKYLQELSEHKNVKSVQLELNYRCGQNIIDGSEIILSPSTPRNYKSSRGEVDLGEINFIQKSGGLEDQSITIVEDIIPKIMAVGYEPKNIAILYLDKNDANILIQALNDYEIKYAGERDKRYPRTPITRWIEELAQWSCGMRGKEGVRFKDLSNYWIKLLNDTGKQISEKNYLIYLKFFFTTISTLQKPEMKIIDWLSELENKLGLINILTLLEDNPYEKESFLCMFSACGNDQPLKDFTVADLAGCGPNANRITLTTLHSSKGLQFDIVIIPGLEEGRLPSWGVQSETAMNEARRTFYVGFTRARYQVYLLYSGWYQNQYGRTFRKGSSRFVSELQKKIECKL
jgi:DNA helicase II / ATP-dependent DNA helicase PcrA